MKAQKSGTNSRVGLSRSTFENDGIPNSPFKNSKSAAMTLAVFGIVLGGFIAASGAVIAFSQHKGAPAAVVQPIKPVASAGQTSHIAAALSDGKHHHTNAQTHLSSKHAKKHAKPKAAGHANLH
ncbi:MAG: hypothetical protein SGJ27_11410 [Candidatus Melainabacteria bacterium]|nr:hypothetical protein [Candidatus Melainabacteria bacterium]